jgi:tRNA A-37 threonylcarbamoyl transferase component Bud32
MVLIVGAGTVLGGRYTLEREIGRGGMASVYLAQDLRQHRRVAVKFLRRDVAISLGPQRFVREIEIASRLTHPHILPVHDSGEAEGLLYYVMPYVEGESLRDRLRREPRLPLDDALTITREIAGALSYAHHLGVIHRDIKPANVLIQSGHAVVADFGVARAITAASDDRVTSAGLIVGTPVYMSPEQAAGEEVDGRTDIYSLGCVAYEMLTGAPPFIGGSPQQVVARHVASPLRPIRSLRPEIPAPAAEAIEKALAKRPGQRQTDASELAEALRAPGGWSETTTVATPPASHHGRRAIAFTVAAAAIGAAGFVLVRPPPRAAGAPVELIVLPLEGDTLPAAAGAPRAHDLFAELIDWMPGFHAADAGTVLPRGRSWRDLPVAELLARAHRAGARYVVAGSVTPGQPGPRVTVDLFSADSGDRLVHASDSADGGAIDGPVGRLAAGLVGAVARREGRELGSAGAVLAATSVLPAVGHMLQAQARFWANDLDGAVSELAAAVEADSSCGLAYQRLSAVNGWRHDYPAALAAAEAGLRHADGMAPRWVQLLRAQRYLVLGYSDSAVATYQSAVLDDRDDVDGWLGLGESLVHYAAFAGASPLDARPAFERMVALDSTFAPVYYHLVDLAVYAGDSAAAAAYLRRILPDHPFLASKVAEVRLRFGPASGRAAALAALRPADRQAISEAVIAWAHGGFALGLADTAASFLQGADRLPDDRLRAAQYRLAIRAAMGRWADGYAAWDSVAHSASIDPWLVQAVLAGYPARARAEPMFEWARTQVRAGRTPDFSLVPWDELRQAFEALVYRAVVEGDAAETRDLLQRLDRAPPAAPSEPSADALRWSLRARLAMLSRDTAAAIDALRHSVARLQEPYTANYPLTALGPQRFLLARLLAARGDSAGADRWRRSFLRSWSVADLFYFPALDSLGAGPLTRPRSQP